jgi:predicted ATP-dependent endonuclease of OLD family
MIEQYFVVEGISDKILLEKMLPPEFVSKTKFIVSEGYNTAISKARSILVTSEIPVYILVDSDTTDLNTIDEKKDYINQMLSQVSVSDRFKVLMSIPETEILLFYDKSIFESLFSVKVDDKQWEHAKYEPKRTLMELIKNYDSDYIYQTLNNKLTDDMAKKLRKNEIIQNIISKN